MRRVISFLKTILIDRLNDFHLFLVLAKMTMPDSQLIIQTFSDFYNLDNLVFSIVVSLQKWLAHFYSRKTLSNQEKRQYLHINDQIKVSRLLLWIGHCNLCLEGHIVFILWYSKSKFLKMEKIFTNSKDTQRHILFLKNENFRHLWFCLLGLVAKI